MKITWTSEDYKFVYRENHNNYTIEYRYYDFFGGDYCCSVNVLELSTKYIIVEYISSVEEFEKKIHDRSMFTKLFKKLEYDIEYGVVSSASEEREFLKSRSVYYKIKNSFGNSLMG